MQYYISDEPIRLREYGRSVQMLVDHARKISDREHRSKVITEIIRIMSTICPQVKDYPEYRQKLWDHIHQIAEYDLDVEGPFPTPDPQSKAQEKTLRLPYPELKPRIRAYGRNVDLMISNALKIADQEQQKAYVQQIANVMKQQLHNIDRDANAETVIMQHIRELSEGRLTYGVDEVTFHRTLKATSNMIHPYKSGKKKKKNKGNVKRHFR